MPPLTKERKASNSNLARARAALRGAVESAVTGVKRMASPRKSPAKRRRQPESENQAPETPAGHDISTLEAVGGPVIAPTPSHAFRRQLRVPSPKKLLFRAIPTYTFVSATPDIVSESSVFRLCDLVVPGVRPLHPADIAHLVAQVQANDGVSPLMARPDISGSVQRFAPVQEVAMLGSNDSDSEGENDSEPDEDVSGSLSAALDDIAPFALVGAAPSVTATPIPDLRSGVLREAPTLSAARAALEDLQWQYKKKRNGGGYTYFELNPFKRDRLDGMRLVLRFYVSPDSRTHGHWGSSSLQASVGLGRGLYCARTLRKLVRAYIANREVLPDNPYGAWRVAMLCDEGIAEEIKLHLRELGTNITAANLVKFVNGEEMRAKYGISHPISLSTGCRVLREMGYRYRHEQRSQYVDGHERGDVVWYRQQVYIPAIKKLLPRTIEFDADGREVHPQTELVACGRCVIIWYHDESIFYAHDRKKRAWYHKDKGEKPKPKGEGASFMVADFVSAEFGWMQAPDGTDARRVLRPGANREGYFTNADILTQAEAAAALVQEHFPEYDHVFVYDNASTHKKRAEDALSARKMPKGPSATFFVERNLLQSDGTLTYDKDKRIVKEKIRMANTTFPSGPRKGEVQELYFGDNHARAGQFKGMVELLVERGWNRSRFAQSTPGYIRAECAKFKCADVLNPDAECCARRILFNQPDFTNVPSLLETAMIKHSIPVIFLPKFHCELNPIEQCWGFAKRIYRNKPISSKDEDLVDNTISSLHEIPLVSIRRFFTRAHRFVDAYDIGLNGAQSAWACRTYRGHRTLPADILRELDKTGLGSAGILA